MSLKPKFTTLMFLIGVVVALGYYLFGVFQFTDNAFVVQVTTPVSPRVSGVINEVHVKNGQQVKQGDVLFSLDPTQYMQNLEAALAQYEKALVTLRVLQKKIDISEQNLKSALANLDILNTQFKAKNHPDVKAGVAQIELADLKNKIKAQQSAVDSIKLQIEIDKLQVEVERQSVLASKAALESAKTSLQYTKVVAPTDGRVENVFLGIGAHVSPGVGMFSLINDGNLYVQANFEETNLTGVKEGDKATIYPRAYLGQKSFTGTVVANPFGVSRQMSQPFSGAPVVQTENKWLLLPQRLPVIINITERDEKFPLVSGMSAYVRIQH